MARHPFHVLFDLRFHRFKVIVKSGLYSIQGHRRDACAWGLRSERFLASALRNPPENCRYCE